VKRIFASLILFCALGLCSALSVHVLSAQEQNEGQNEARHDEQISGEDREIIENMELLENIELFIEDDIDMIQNLDIFLANS